ncbi:MAG: ISAzo13 family transposase [Deltaproteobacteria bacterium]|nr:ISAzo13 family transposase [Deltaproteobacteria bacterium]
MIEGAEELIQEKYGSLAPAFNEAALRLWAATEARALGHGGIATVARATGLSRNTVMAGLRELDDPTHRDRLASGRVRRPGAGRKPLTTLQPDLGGALDRLVSPATRGDPMSPLRWTSKSPEKLAVELKAEGFKVGADTVASLLKAQGYSLQGTRKTKEGGDHPDRDAQFRHIATEVTRMQAAEQPVISVDCKKKELIGEFKNAGREWQPVGQPEAVNVYDFPDMADGKAIPYGVYDVTRNEGWVSVGIDHDTAEFAVGTIRQWWRRMGKPRYQGATSLLVTADGGGSNGTRNRLWKSELQRLADDTGLTIHVSHLPPGTSKWNKIEHRLFGQITTNWRGKPLVTLEAVVGLIANTTTKTGLKVRAAADQKSYPTGRKVTDEEMAALALTRSDFHGEWNYSITPRVKTPRK